MITYKLGFRAYKNSITLHNKFLESQFSKREVDIEDIEYTKLSLKGLLHKQYAIDFDTWEEGEYMHEFMEDILGPCKYEDFYLVFLKRNHGFNVGDVATVFDASFLPKIPWCPKIKSSPYGHDPGNTAFKLEEGCLVGADMDTFCGCYDIWSWTQWKLVRQIDELSFQLLPVLH